MNPLAVTALVAILFLSWLGTNVLEKRGKRKRQRAVQAPPESSRQTLPLMNRQGDEDKRFFRSHTIRSRMLSVGRERNISEVDVVCRACAWEGIGSQLSTGLARIDRSGMLLYAYRCPVCSGFELSRKGKLLAFGSRNQTNEDRASATCKDQRSGATGRL